MDKILEKSNQVSDEIANRTALALESIANSLNTLAEDAKAIRILREENKETLYLLEASIKEIKEDPFNLKS